MSGWVNVADGVSDIAAIAAAIAAGIFAHYKFAPGAHFSNALWSQSRNSNLPAYPARTSLSLLIFASLF